MTVRQFLETNESSIGSNGAAWDSCDALKQLNKTRSAFYGIGDWDGNTDFICIRCYSGKIYLPWFAQRIISAFKCKGMVKIAPSEHYAIVNEHNCGQRIEITDNNQYSPTPIANSFNGPLNFMSRDSEDNGVEIKVSYLAENGSLINDRLILEKDHVQYPTNFHVSSIKAISKPSTNGPIFVSDCACSYLFYISPYVTSVQHRVYCITGCCCGDNDLITVRVKKAYYPFSELHYDHHTDFPDHALALGMEAIAARGNRTTEGIAVYEKLFRDAVQFLNKQKQTSVHTTQDASTNVLNEVNLMEDVTYGGRY